MIRATQICGSALMALGIVCQSGCASQSGAPAGARQAAADAKQAAPVRREQALLDDLAVANRNLARGSWMRSATSASGIRTTRTAISSHPKWPPDCGDRSIQSAARHFSRTCACNRIQ